MYWAFSPSTDWLKALCIEATRPLALPLAMAWAIAWRALWPAVDTSVRALSWADSWEETFVAVCTYPSTRVFSVWAAVSASALAPKPLRSEATLPLETWILAWFCRFSAAIRLAITEL